MPHKLPTKCWAKLNRSKEENSLITGWLSLLDHSADVAACCEAALNHTLIRRRLATLSGLNDLDPCQRQRLCVLAGYHDVGKFGHGFQNKWFMQAPFKSGHVLEVLPFFAEKGGVLNDRFAEAMAFDELSTWAEDPATVTQLLIAAICHHGKPEDFEHGDIQKSHWAPTTDRDPMAGIAELTQSLKTWFPHAWGPGSLLPSEPAFQHAFSGLVMLADWIGSDTDFFPLTEE